MKVAQFQSTNQEWIGVEVNGRWVNYTKAESAWARIEYEALVEPATNLGELIERGEFQSGQIAAVVKFVNDHRLQQKLSDKGVMKAPVSRPRKIVALGLNYALHAKEGNFQVPKEPIIFSKAGSSVIGPGETIRIPRGLGRMDHEVELAVVIGKKATNVRKKNAVEYIAGYTIANDVSARDLQKKDVEKKHPWFRSKSFDTFTPLGPWIVTTDELKQPNQLDIKCLVNGKLRQHANTRNMIFDIPAQIEFITKYITLEPGDVISTGTPEGIGPIKGGDTVVCRIEGIGELKNPVRYR